MIIKLVHIMHYSMNLNRAMLRVSKRVSLKGGWFLSDRVFHECEPGC